MTGRGRAAAFAAASGLLLALAFPSANLGTLAWFALVPLFVVVAGRAPAGAAGFGWVTGFVFALGTLYWVVNPITHYTSAPAALAGLALLLLAAAVGGYFAVFAGGLALVARAGAPAWIAAPALWVTIEWARAAGPLAFPWVALGYSQHRHLAIAQLAEVTGVYGVSALLVFGNAVVYDALCTAGRGRARRVAALLGLAVLIAGVWVGGTWRRAAVLRAPRSGRIAVGVVQANIDQGQKWDPVFQTEAIERHVRLTAAAAAAGAQLVVWPETAAPFFFQSEFERGARLLDLAATARIDLLFGSPAFAEDGGRLRFLNRAYLVGRDGTVGDHYDKLRLVPFGEYIPLQPLLFFVDKLVEGVGDFAPGDRATVFSLPEGRFGVLICYEGIFPSLSRRLVADGANFLVNITNDAWFGDTSAPHQHLAMVTFRAIENRTPVVRAANTGVSALIDVDGAVRWQTALFAPAQRVDVVTWARLPTIYTRIGDAFAAACALASILLVSYGLLRRRRGTANGPRG